jgi:hypothetical protein
MPLFEVAILEKPTKKEYEEEGKTEKLVYGPVPTVAKDVQAAALTVGIKAKSSMDFDPNKIEVLVRPFA